MGSDGVGADGIRDETIAIKVFLLLEDAIFVTLEAGGISKVGDLKKAGKRGLRACRGIGRVRAKQVEAAFLDTFGYPLK